MKIAQFIHIKNRPVIYEGRRVKAQVYYPSADKYFTEEGSIIRTGEDSTPNCFSFILAIGGHEKCVHYTRVELI